MKRHVGTESSLFSEEEAIKRIKTIHQDHEDGGFSDLSNSVTILNITNLDHDSLGYVMNFIPVGELLSCRLVHTTWNEIIGSQRVPSFWPVKNLMQYCEEAFKDERNDELYVSLKKWLSGKIVSLNIDGSGLADLFVDSPNPLVVKKYPAMTVISSTLHWVNSASYVEVMIHIKESVKIRMHMHLSNAEDELVYVNVERNTDPLFDWKLLNIDPNVTNILVHQIDGTGDHEVNEYYHNPTFFNYIGSLLAPNERFRRNSFCFTLIDIFLKRPKSMFCKPPLITSNHSCNNAVEFEYADELRELLIQKPLEKLNDFETVYMMNKLLSNMYSNCLNNINKDEDLIVDITNVKGSAYSNEFRKDMHFINTTFDLCFNNKVYKCKLDVKEKFYYGTDGYEGDHSFTIIDTETSKNYGFYGIAYGINETVVWSEVEMDIIISIGLDSQFDSVKSFIEYLIDSLLEKLPIIDSFHCTATNCESLRTYLIGTFY